MKELNSRSWIATVFLGSFAIAALFLAMIKEAGGADLPTDLVGVAKNNADGTMFFTVYPETLPTVKGSVKCSGNWHVVVSTTKDGPLFGCWVFDTVSKIDVVWADGDKTQYSADSIELADWFTNKYPEFKRIEVPKTPSPKGGITRQPNDTIANL